jgi:hypothetical protein
MPQCARGLGDLPLAVVGHEADLGMLAAAVVGRADLPPEVHRADLPLLVLGLLRQQNVRRQLPHVRGLGHLDQLGRLCLAGGCADGVLLDGGRVDRVDRTLDVVLPVGGLAGVPLSKPVDVVPGDDPPVTRGPVRLREAGRLVPHGVDAVLVDKDGVIQLLELCPELKGLVGGGGVGGALGLLEPQLEVLDVVEEGGTEYLQLVVLQILVLDVAVPDVGKSQFVGVGAD